MVYLSPRVYFADDDVPTDNETVPEELTIEETTLKYTNYFDDTPEFTGLMTTVMVPPKPIAWVFPKYPKEDKDKGVYGTVKLSIHVDETGRVIDVVVLSNSTGSERCAQAAVNAAYGSRFIPAKEGRKAVRFWITQPYTFDLRD
jgi:TonB family protein